ncbi:repair protein Rad1/Rec1/Rad17 containing protein [Aphelenchoides avenae]|nr:repair protein Rad1/Rec1/Rad17 containing protein [Aphelenchus avenae]
MSSAGTQQDTQRHPVEVHKDNARELYPLLKGLMFREHCSVTICQGGIRVIVDDQHHQQATVYLKYDLFTHFDVQDGPTIQLRIPMSAFTECLNVFASQTSSLKMYYDGEGHPLVLHLNDDGITFVCEITTQIPEAVLDFDFNPDDLVAKVISRPQLIREVFRDFDSSSPTVRISVTPAEFAFYTTGDLGKVKIAIPSHSEHLEVLDCVVDRVSYQYRLALIKRMVPSLALCSRVSFRIDNRGVLSIQFLVPQAGQQTVFVEFYCVADNDEYD